MVDRSATSRVAEAVFQNRYLLVLAVVIIFLSGISAFNNIPRIEDPQIVARHPQIITALPGASATRVEALLTDPLEDSLREISELKKVKSHSLPGISIINLELRPEIGSSENEQVFSKIQNQIKGVAAELPPGASQPFFNDKNNAIAFSKVIAISWNKPGPAQLGLMSRLAEELADVLRNFQGTELVRIYGSPDEEVVVGVNGDQLSALSLDVSALASTIQAADAKLPAGAVRSIERDLLMEVGGQIDNLARIRAIPVQGDGNGATVSLGDIATVEKRWRDPPSDMALANGRPAILVAVRTSNSVRLDEWAQQASLAIEEFSQTLGGGFDIETVFDQNIYTNKRLATLGGNLLAGALLVMVVVLVGMGWRAALIVGAALPLSASLALFGLEALGQQLHQMAIFGMIIAIGLLIDNAIVMTDELKQQLDKGHSRLESVRHALQHLFVPLLASTLTTILGFMPVFLLPGAMGDFVGPIAISVVLALTASFVISISIVPALGGLFIHRAEPGVNKTWWCDGLRSRRLAQRYREFMQVVLRRPLLSSIVCVILPIAGFFLASTLGEQFFPPADRNQFEVVVRMPPNSAIENTAKTAADIEKLLRAEPGVTEVHWRIGASYPTIYYNRIMTEQSNNAFAHAMVYTDSLKSANRLTTVLPTQLSKEFTGAQIIVAPFAQGPPVDAPVGFSISGPDINVLRSLGSEVRRVMHTVPGVLQTRATVSSGRAKLELDVDEIAARDAGLSLSSLARQLQAGLEGQSGGALLEDLEELPVVVRLAENERDSLAAVEGLMLSAPGGEVPVSALGNFTLTPAVSRISRLDGVRTNEVLAYLARDALAIDVSKEVNSRLSASGFSVPPGYRFTVGGDSAEQSNAFGSLFTYLPILLMLMIATIILSFRSMRLAAIIGVVAVLSVGLGMFSLWIGGYARGFNAIIGSVGLVGVAINGTIVVLAGIKANPAAVAGDLTAVVDEVLNSTRHIVSTTLTTVGGFIPLLLFTGGDFWPPLAIVIAGGVAFSISLSLIFSPSMFVLTNSKKLRSNSVGIGGEALA